MGLKEKKEQNNLWDSVKPILAILFIASAVFATCFFAMKAGERYGFFKACESMDMYLVEDSVIDYFKCGHKDEYTLPIFGLPEKKIIN